MLLPIIIILVFIILLLLICACASKIKKKEIRYPATFGVKKPDYIMECLEEML
jgi:hypothetical protein